MANLAKVLQQLRNERAHEQRRLEQLDQASKVLDGLGGLSGRGRHFRGTGGRRTMSVAVRKRSAAVQRARWAKWKAGRNK